MRLLHLILPVLAMTALSAQSIEIYSGTTSFTSRGNIGVNAGEILQGFHESHWKGIGDTGAGAFLTGMTIVTQDQNAATQETYDLVVRVGTDAAGPTTGVAGEICSVIGLMPPLGANGPAAWVITTNFATGGCRIPTKSHLAAGIRVPVSGWTADGQSLHMTNAGAHQSGPHQQDHGWQILGAAATAVHFASSRSVRVALLTSAPILQNGVFATTTTAYSRGMGGMFPPTGTHGWSTHVDGGTGFASGVAGLFLSPAVINPGFPVPGIRGTVYLGSPLISLATVPLDANGRANVSLVDPIGLYGITVYLQAILANISPPGFALTNVNATTFQ